MMSRRVADRNESGQVEEHGRRLDNGSKYGGNKSAGTVTTCSSHAL